MTGDIVDRSISTNKRFRPLVGVAPSFDSLSASLHFDGSDACSWNTEVHKLDALLGARQLERYLQLAPQRTWVALIASAYQSAPAEELIDPRFLAPEGKSHFRWSDFYEAVRSQAGWLAEEFADYMKSLGMAPFHSQGERGLL